MQVAIDRFGRMVLPKAIRERIGLDAGDVLEAREERGAIVLRPTGRTDALRSAGRVLVFGGKADGDIRAALALHREGRLVRVAGRMGRA